MFRATAVPRFSAAQVHLQPPSSSVSQLMRTASVQSPASNGRVAMMPGTNGDRSEASRASAPAQPLDAAGAQPANTMASMDDILTVGTVSAQGDGQKVSTAAQAEI